MARTTAAIGDTVQWLTGGLLTNRILTTDQLKNLGRHNVVGKSAKTFADLGITPTPMAAVTTRAAASQAKACARRRGRKISWRVSAARSSWRWSGSARPRN